MNYAYFIHQGDTLMQVKGEKVFALNDLNMKG